MPFARAIRNAIIDWTIPNKRRDTRAPRLRAVVAIAACVIARATVVHAGSAGDGDWRMSLGPIAGVVMYDPNLANYRWDTQPAVQSGAQLTVYRGRFGAGARLWRAYTTQATGIPGENQTLRVALTGMELSGQMRVVRYAGFELWGSAHGGWLHLGYDPDQLVVGVGGSPLTVVFDPVSELNVGAGLQVRRDLSRHLSLAVHGDGSSFALDTAHRVGNEIVYSRERFHNWIARLEISWLFAWN